MALKEILAHQREANKDLLVCTEALFPSDRSFLKALHQSACHPAVIAELKPKSPAAGALAQADYQPTVQARWYEEGGAAALSVLTELHYFGGSLADLTAVRAAIRLPVLCKDFILDEQQVKWARHAGADACLLIVAALSKAELVSLKAAIEALNMLAVIEVHTLDELSLALSVDPEILLINNRNLWDLSMHPDTTRQLLPMIPKNLPVISASGFTTLEDIKALPDRITAVLVGTQLMKEGDPRLFLKALQSASM